MSERILIQKINENKWSVSVIDMYDDSLITEYFTNSRKDAEALAANLSIGSDEYPNNYD
jgi:hypothetical protein